MGVKMDAGQLFKVLVYGAAICFSATWGYIRLFSTQAAYQTYKISDMQVVECAKYERIGDYVWLKDCKFGKSFSSLDYTDVVELKQ
jgi:hypothetical protein